MEDRISSLPDDVVQQILHLLPLKDAVRTSILSKRWRKMDVCCTFPLLNFTRGFFENPPLKCQGRSCNKNVRKKNRRSLDIVDKLLRRRPGSNHDVQKFQLLIPTRYQCGTHPFLAPLELISQCPLQSKLNRWMNVVAKPGFTVLDLRVFFRYGEYYNFPLTTLAEANLLKTLSLAGFQLKPLGLDRVDFSFPCLEKMNLESVVVDDSVMQKLLKGSPLLENLRLIDCNGLEILKVEGLNRLKMLDVIEHHLKKIVIDAPCLRVLKIACGDSPLFITVPTCPKFLQQLELELSACDCNFCYPCDTPFELEGTQLPIEKWLCGLADKCCLLEHMSISCIPVVEELHISSTLPALKTLNLINVDNLVSLKIVAPNLEKLLMVPTKELPRVSLNDSEKLQVRLSMLDFDPPGELNEQWYSRWAEFLSCFKHYRSLVIVDDGKEICFVPKESRKDLSGSLFDVKTLELRMITRMWPRPRISDYLDYLLWLSPRATKLILQSFTCITSGTEVVLKCLYDETKVVDDNKDNCCEDCKLLEVRCWRHSLKQVIIEEFEGDEMMKQDIKSFFQEQVENVDFSEPVSDSESLENGLYYYYNKLFE